MNRAAALGLGVAALMALQAAAAEVKHGVSGAEAAAAAASVGRGERWDTLRVYVNDPTVFFLHYRSSPRLPWTAELDAKQAAAQIVAYLTKAGHDVSAEQVSIIVFAQESGTRLPDGKTGNLHLGAAIFNPRNGLVYWEPGW